MKEKKKPLDSTHAPEGYVAVPMPEHSSDVDCCIECAFSVDKNCPAGEDRPCIRDERPDGWDVIFILKED